MAAHGTHARYQKHRYDGDAPCEECRRAHSAYKGRCRKIRGRVLTRLADIYPDIYAALLSEETARLRREEATS